MEEKSKGSTSEEESDFESDAEPADLTKKGSTAAKVMPGVYLSTNLITERSLTLADISIDTYTPQVILNMESELIGVVKKFKSKPLLIDPKAELKVQKLAGNSTTLVDYDRIDEIIGKARTMHLDYLLEQDKEGFNPRRDDIFDM